VTVHSGRLSIRSTTKAGPDRWISPTWTIVPLFGRYRRLRDERPGGAVLMVIEPTILSAR